MGINSSYCVGLEVEQVKAAWQIDWVILAWQKGGSLWKYQEGPGLEALPRRRVLSSFGFSLCFHLVMQ